MVRKAFKTLLGVLTILSLVLSAFFVYSMFGQYEESVRWDSSSLLSDIHNVPPELAKNYVSGNEAEIAQVLAEVNNALDLIRENEGIQEDMLDDYSELYKKASRLIKEGELEDSDITKPLKSLGLYLQTEKAINNAYEVVDTENLSKYSEQLASRLNGRDNELDEIYLNRLSGVAQDYQDLEDFSKRAMDALGIIEADTLYVDLQVDKATTESILEELSDSNLLKFSNTRQLESMLRSDPWMDILDHNQSTNQYYSWEKSREILEGILHTSYKPVSDFKGLQDALDYQPNLTLHEVDGYELNIENSTINQVYYQGDLLEDGMYIKKGIPLKFDIDYAYIEVEIIEVELIEPEEEIEEEIEDKSDKKSDKKPKTKSYKKSQEKPQEKPQERPKKDPENGDNGSSGEGGIDREDGEGGENNTDG